MEKKGPLSVSVSRVLSLPLVIALGLTLPVGLGLFAFLGHFGHQTTGVLLYIPFVLLGIISLPIVLAFAQLSSSRPSGKGAFYWTDSKNHPYVTFASGWILVAGYISLAALLGLAAASCVRQFIAHFFALEIPTTWLAASTLALAGLGSLGKSFVRWRSIGAVALIAVLFLLFVTIDTFAVLQTNPEASAGKHTTVDSLLLAAQMSVLLWFVHLVLGEQARIKRPLKSVTYGLLSITIILVILGSWTALVLNSIPQEYIRECFPLLAKYSYKATVSNQIAISVFLGFGAILCFWALHRVIINGDRVIGALNRLAGQTSGEKSAWLHGMSRAALLILPACVIAVLLPRDIVVSITGVLFLWSVAIIHFPNLFKKDPFAKNRATLSLPFHPLVPAISVAIGIFLPVKLGIVPISICALWMLVGLVIYIAIVRPRRTQVEEQNVLLNHESSVDIKDRQYTVLATIGGTNEERDCQLIETASRIATFKQGVLLVLDVLDLPETMSYPRKQKLANKALERLNTLLDNKAQIDVSNVSAIIRIAPSNADGIESAVSESSADILFLGYKEALPKDLRPSHELNRLLRNLPCDVALLKDGLPHSLNKIVIPNGDGPDTPLALSLAEAITTEQSTEINLFQYAVRSAVDSEDAQSSFEALKEKTQNPDRITQEISRGANIEASIVSAADASNFLVIGMARDGLMAVPFAEGVPGRILDSTKTPALMVRTREKTTVRLFKRAWGLLTHAFPTLDWDERRTLITTMEKSAVPNVDYYMMMILSSGIASLGLLQNSAAVIIGAMLVAPLMSPILAMAMATVQGKVQMLKGAAEATSKGIAVAIGVGIAMVVISPITEPTGEIIARTAPNVLDLLVAIVSGAAAGYAMGRRDLSAALPGVAIAAALVPPLAVTGYGIGTANFAMAIGSFLLFTTNLVAIVVSAALVFLALGLTPQVGREKRFVKNLRNAFVALIAVCAVLISMTVYSVGELNRKLKVEEILNKGMEGHGKLLNDFKLKKKGNEYDLRATLLSYEGKSLSPDKSDQLRRELSQAVGRPINLDITTVGARKYNMSAYVLTHMAGLQSRFTEIMKRYPVHVESLTVTPQGESFVIYARVVELKKHALVPEDIAVIKHELRTHEEVEVELEVVVLTGNVLTSEF